MIVLQFIVTTDSKCGKDGTICNFLLRDFESIDSCGDVRHTIDELLVRDHVLGPGPLL